MAVFQIIQMNLVRNNALGLDNGILERSKFIKESLKQENNRDALNVFSNTILNQQFGEKITEEEFKMLKEGIKKHVEMEKMNNIE